MFPRTARWRALGWSRITVRLNLAKPALSQESLVKNKNSFGDRLNAVVSGRAGAGQMGLDSDDRLRQIIATSNLGPTAPAAAPKETVAGAHADAADPDAIHRQFPNLPLDRERQRSSLAKRLEKYLDSLQDAIFTATRTLNDVTGYSLIEKLKQSIEDLELSLKQSRDEVKRCKEAYSEAINRRSQLQKEVNELLTRKHDWSPDDLERFTTLYRNDHANEQAEQSTQQALDRAERAVDSIQLKLTQLILTRYHEEQIWSDKIRRALTWGTWIIMGLNMMLFVVATLVVEPWKRARLVGSFEDKVRMALREARTETAVAAAVAAAAPAAAVPPLPPSLAPPPRRDSPSAYWAALKHAATQLRTSPQVTLPTADWGLLLGATATVSVLTGTLVAYSLTWS